MKKIFILASLFLGLIMINAGNAVAVGYNYGTYSDDVLGLSVSVVDNKLTVTYDRAEDPINDQNMAIWYSDAGLLVASNGNSHYYGVKDDTAADSFVVLHTTDDLLTKSYNPITKTFSSASKEIELTDFLKGRNVNNFSSFVADIMEDSDLQYSFGGKLTGSTIGLVTITDVEMNIAKSVSDSYTLTSATPIPGAALFLCTGLVGLVGMRRRIKV